MSRPRTTPYTVLGIKRVPCWRCGNPSWANWQICADGNQFRGICMPCDIKLNDLVLGFMGDPDRAVKMHDYRVRLRDTSWVDD